MAFTKLGQDTLPKYLWKGVTTGVRGLKGLISSKPYKYLKSKGTNIANTSSYLLGGVTKGVTGAGKFIYNKPYIAVPAVALGYLGATGIGKNIYKNMYHVDPKYNLSYSNALGQIKYYDPRYRKEYEQLGLFQI